MSSVWTPPYELSVETPLGPGKALFVELEGEDNFWTVALAGTQAIVTFPQNKIRVCRSYTHERGIDDMGMREIIKK